MVAIRLRKALCRIGRFALQTVADHRWLIFARLSLQLPLAVSEKLPFRSTLIFVVRHRGRQFNKPLSPYGISWSLTAFTVRATRRF
jgi:hypothetical protein